MIQPEEVLRLPPWAAIALLPGVRPIFLEKLPYFRQPTKLREFCSRLVGGVGAALVTVVAPVQAFGLYVLLVGNDDPVVRGVAKLVQQWFRT